MNQNFEHDISRNNIDNQILKYSCPKCGNKQYEVGEVWAFSSFWTKLFQLHTRRFTFLTCQRCKYTELYKVPKKEIGEVINFMSR
jgi:predicted nucleic-acid-binding Zn-ribbon protein